MKIREMRKSIGVSRKELAERLGVTVNAINKYENNQAQPKISTLIKLADLFNVSVDTLIGHDADLLDLKTLDENRKLVVDSVVYKLTDSQVSKVIKFILDNMITKD